MERHAVRGWLAALFVLGISPGLVRAQEAAPVPPAVTDLSLPTPTTVMGPAPTAAPEDEGSAVTLNDAVLLRVYGRLGAFTQDERAAAITRRIDELARQTSLAAPHVTVVEGEQGAEIVAGDRVLMTVTPADAAALGTTPDEAARRYARAIAQAIATGRRQTGVRSIVIGIVFTILATAVLVLLFKGLGRAVPAAIGRLKRWKGTVIPSIRIQRLELLSAERIIAFFIFLAKAVRVALSVLALYFYLPLVFSFFPWTRGLAKTLFSYIAAPLAKAWHRLIAYVPNLFSLLVIVALTYYFVKFVRLVFTEIRRGTVTFPGFERDWAEPTYKIARFLVIVFAAIVAFPYLPGSDSPAFKGVSIFLGILFSLSSSSAIANVVAGVILTYTKAFRIGDRVKIADTVGDVVEKTLLVTRVRTIKNVDITIPNAMVLGAHIINFSTSARERGLVLHTTVTIGYDAPWRQVHELLLTAGRKTTSVLDDPEPFVLQTGLSDYYPSYELNVYTDSPGAMSRIYSELHQNIQDVFNDAGVEIMSPSFTAMRDGNRTTIPESYLPASYQAGGFRIVETKPPRKPRRPRKSRAEAEP